MAKLMSASAQCSYSTTPTPEDPYRYQTGFGNQFASEAIPGTLPVAQNTPQKCKYDLFSEQLNGTTFISSRASLQHAWFYRIMPSVAHQPFLKSLINPFLEANFSLSNPRVEYGPSELSWAAFDIPSQEAGNIHFIEGIRTIGGHGDPTLKEGLAIHLYTCNVSMKNRAFCNNDGDFLILPQQGRLDVQTEFGRLMVQPGELLVIQAGMRFSVAIPDGPSRGYIQEIFGSHYELPELGPVGSNGMAYPRDFEMPVASFDIDQSNWKIFYKLGGRLFECQQDHTPFDVVAWHGNYCPYKYALEKFVNIAMVDRDQSDPSIYCVLVARSKIPGVNLTEFLIFTEKTIATKGTFRPPYFHRNMASEVMGMMYGKWGGSGHLLEPGGLSYEPSYMPHGESYERCQEATNWELKPERIFQDTMAFMMHINSHLSITQYALSDTSAKLHPPMPDLWTGVKGGFLNHIEQVNKDLKAAGLPSLKGEK